MEPLYTAEALSVGDARNGQAYLADRSLDLKMSVPKEMGGAGEGANPEQLFALGYAACFHSALKLVAGKAKADTTDSAIGARVSIGSNDQGGFQLAVVLEVSLPNVSPRAGSGTRGCGTPGLPLLQRDPRQYRRTGDRRRRLTGEDSPSRIFLDSKRLFQLCGRAFCCETLATGSRALYYRTRC